MTLELYFAYFAASTILIIVPGPIVSLVIANSLTHGTVQGVVTVGGAQAAILIQLVIVSLGLGSLMALTAEWVQWLRWIGAAYLIWLGVQKWRAEPLLPEERPSRDVRGYRLFWQGFLVSMTNPKSLFFFSAFFPQFVNPNAPVAPQLWLLCTTFLVIGIISDSGYAVLAGRARSWLRNRQHVLIGERVTGSILIGGGLWLALARRV